MKTELKRVAALANGLLYRWQSRPSSLNVVFVVGAPRSGTTLVQTILTRHPDFRSIEAETGFFRPDFLHRAQRWTGQRREIMDACKGRSLTELFDGFARVVAGSDAGLTFVEKTPQHILDLGWILSHFPQARVVHILRDPRDGLASAMDHPRMPQNTAERYARYWNRCLRSRLKIGAESRVFDLEYEILAQEPQSAIRDLMAFLGRPVDPGQFDSGRTATDRRSRLGHHAHIAEPISAKSIGRYRTRLDDGQIRTVERITGRTYRTAKDALFGGGHVRR